MNKKTMEQNGKSEIDLIIIQISYAIETAIKTMGHKMELLVGD